MAAFYDLIDEKLAAFIAAQPIYFVATAAATGRINLSPKGMDSLRVLGPNRVIWLNVTGSGNETAAHLAQNNRITIMFCSFDKAPLILRLYGTAQTVHQRDDAWSELYAHFPDYLGARNIFDVTVESVQTSCGFAVPFMEFAGERPTAKRWAEQ
ncbi:MAG: pyridoxamine 5'-phosphate oxidase family protein, partial [Anaerolineales bacterium]|nr:pyridoxamine 5'-phosphate oxidase family protein [Anaerolineales bacterium]